MHGNLQLASKRRKERRPIERPDGPTPERLRIAGEDYVRGDSGTYTLQDSPLERMLARGLFTSAQYCALTKYRLHWYRSGLAAGLQSLDPNRIFASDDLGFSGMAKTESQAFHRQQFRNAVQEIGLISAAILDDVVCHEKTLEDAGYRLGWGSKPQAIAGATERVKSAADRLVKHWGIS